MVNILLTGSMKIVKILSSVVKEIFVLKKFSTGVFYLKIWVPDKPPIDRQGCTCSCFDTVFRGKDVSCLYYETCVHTFPTI